MSLIGGTIGSIAINLTSNFLYDLLKGITKKIDKKTIDDLVSEFDYSFVDSELDLGSFNKFLSLSKTKMLFQQYIRYTSFIKMDLNCDLDFSLGRGNFIKSITNLAIKFVKEDTNNQMDKYKVEKYFTKLLDYIETKLIDNLPEQFTAIPYFVAKAIRELEERLSQNVNIKIEQEIAEYSNIKEEYTKVLMANDTFSKLNIYQLARNLNFYSFYVFPRLIIENDNIQNQTSFFGENHDEICIDWKDIFSISNIVSVIGGAGFGKTLFLKNIVNSYKKMNLLQAEEILPIYCNLKDYITFAKNRMPYSIEDFLLDSMIQYTGIDIIRLNKKFLKCYLDSGRCLILLDALDEVDINERDILCKKLLGFFRVTNKNNKICITTRDRGLIPNTPIVYKVLPINENQINTFLRKMINLGKFKKKDFTLFIDQCQLLLASGFLTNFLILTLLMSVFDTENTLPKSKIELYDKCTKYIARKRERDDKRVNYNFNLMNSILDSDDSFEELSALCKPNNNEVSSNEIMTSLKLVFSRLHIDENNLINAINEFLRFCSDRTELFVLGSKDDNYKFFHRSFFEYYYSKYIIKHEDNNGVINLLLNFDYDSEMFELTPALLKANHYSRYINFLECFLNQLKTDIILKKDYSKILFAFLCALSVSEEEYFLNEFYNLCITNNLFKIADKHFMSDKYICENIIKFKNPEFLIEDSVRYWKDQMIVHFFVQEIMGKNHVTYKKKFGCATVSWRTQSFHLFDYLYNLYKPRFKEVVKNSSFEEINNALRISELQVLDKDREHSISEEKSQKLIKSILQNII